MPLSPRIVSHIGVFCNANYTRIYDFQIIDSTHIYSCSCDCKGEFDIIVVCLIQLPIPKYEYS